MTFLAKHLGEILSTDWQTLAVIAVLCALSGYFLREYLANPPMIVFVYPVLMLFSVIIQYVFVQAELFPPKKLDQWLMWTILAAILGNMIGILVVAGLATLRDRSGARRA
jgi:hypothetical protein